MSGFRGRISLASSQSEALREPLEFIPIGFRIDHRDMLGFDGVNARAMGALQDEAIEAVGAVLFEKLIIPASLPAGGEIALGVLVQFPYVFRPPRYYSWCGFGGGSSGSICITHIGDSPHGHKVNEV